MPAAIALDVRDLNTGYDAGFNARKSMPAASTIKLPVMVAVFEALEAGRFDLNHRRNALVARQRLRLGRSLRCAGRNDLFRLRAAR